MTATDSIQEQIAKAKTLGEQGDAEAATAMLGRVIQQDSGNVDAWLALADVVGEPKRAEQCLQKVLKLDPDNALARQKLASMQGGRVSVGLGSAASVKGGGAPTSGDGTENSPRQDASSIPEAEGRSEVTAGGPEAEATPRESVPDPELEDPGMTNKAGPRFSPDRLDLILIGLTAFFALVLCGLVAAAIF